MGHLVVKVNRVPQDFVLLERLAMVRRHHDHRILIPSPSLQGIQEAAHLLIGEQDLTGILPFQPGQPLRRQRLRRSSGSGENRDVIGFIRPGLAPGLETNGMGQRRVIVVMHIPQVHVKKDRPIPCLLQQTDRFAHRPGPRDVAVPLGGEDKLVKATVEAVVIGEGERRHHSGSEIAGFLQPLGEGRHGSVQRAVIEIHVVRLRVEPGEQRHH